VKGALWPSKEICDELVGHGLAMKSAALLERVTAVPKSSTSAIGERPKPLDHIRSMAVVKQQELELRKITRITIVDDVITRGATLLAAASILQHHFPEAVIRIFAVVRTKSYEPEVGSILDPVLGDVSLNGVDADRKP
jgi:predicted amidophosphoribosyltransferase